MTEQEPLADDPMPDTKEGKAAEAAAQQPKGREQREAWTDEQRAAFKKAKDAGVLKDMDGDGDVDMDDFRMFFGAPPKSHKHLYFDGTTWLARLLRFLNLLEPGRMVLSHSKIMLWFMLFMLAGATSNLLATKDAASLGQIGALVASLVGSVGALYNYVDRRKTQVDMTKTSAVMAGVLPATATTDPRVAARLARMQARKNGAANPQAASGTSGDDSNG
jgi:hypothetical protein